MERAWYRRVALIVVVAIWSVWQLVPSYHYFKLPPDERNGEVYDKSVPGWAPDAKHHLNLGLDLQGGIHLAMGVDVDRAVKAKVARRADEVAEHLKEKSVPFTSVAPDATGLRIAVATTAPGDAERVTLDYYGAELYAPGGAPEGQVLFAFKDQVLREFKGKAVEQAEKTIRNRVDKWGVSEPDIKRKANNQIQIQLPGFKDPEKAKDLLGRTAQLEFKICDDENPVLDARPLAAPGLPVDPRRHDLPAPRGRLLDGGDRRPAQRRAAPGHPGGGQQAGRARGGHRHQAQPAHRGRQERHRHRRGDGRPGRGPPDLLPDLPARAPRPS